MTPTVIDDARFEDLRFIASNLRDEDKLELSVTRDIEDWPSLAISAYGCFYKKVAIWERLPRFAFGAAWTESPRTVQVWGFGTPNAVHVLKPVTRYIKAAMIPELLAMGVLEARAPTHPANSASHRWLRFLGYAPKATISGIGSRKEDLLLFTVDANDLRRDSPPSSSEALTPTDDHRSPRRH